VFHGTVDEARQEARERNVPLLVHILVDEEVCSVAYLNDVLSDPSLAEMSARAVVIVGSDGEHPQATLETKVDGEVKTRTVCSALPWFPSCTSHATARDRVWQAYKDASGDMRAPQTIVELAEGGISWRHDTSTCPPVAAVIDALAEAQETSGKGLTIEEHTRVLEHVEAGERALERSDFPAAFEHLNAVLALAPDGALAQQVRPGRDKAEAAVVDLIEDWLPRLVPGTAPVAYAKLADVEDHVLGTPHARRVTKALDKAGRDRALSAALAPAKLSREATGLLRAYRTQVRDGENRKATVTLRRLLKPKYADTVAGRQAAAEHPDLAKKVRR
jgi:hypothetical protein